jgi:uncharacterized repeat protein (TIGR04076 family)
LEFNKNFFSKDLFIFQEAVYMSNCKITVLKTMLNKDLADEYGGMEIKPCEVFSVGQEFITHPFDKPAGFCDWAWNDIYKSLLTISRGGDFSKGFFNKWMKKDNTMIVGCTDGIRPVIFKIERLDG